MEKVLCIYIISIIALLENGPKSLLLKVDLVFNRCIDFGIFSIHIKFLIKPTLVNVYILYTFYKCHKNLL